jgi:hypothetical protein
MLLRVF